MGQDSSSEKPGPAGDPAAAAIALGHGPLDPRAAAYLEEQTRLVMLQSASLREQHALEMWHLHFRLLSDWARFGLEVLASVIVLLALGALATMVWDATRDDDLVVEAFSVPPDVAALGMTGSVLANRVLDRFGAMDRDVHSFAQDFSAYHGSVAEEVRVEIPNTGVSFGELNRGLRALFGHEIHVTGELVHTAKGLALTVRYGGRPSATTENADMNLLIGKAAENIFEALRPLRFADYLSAHGRVAEAETVLRRETQSNDTAYRSNAYASWGQADYWRGDYHALGAHGEMAVSLNPKNTAAWFIQIAAANNLSHEEEVWTATNAFLPLAQAGAASSDDPAMARAITATIDAGKRELIGDYSAAEAACDTPAANHLAYCDPSNMGVILTGAHELARARASAEQAPFLQPNGKVNADRLFLHVQIEIAAGDWPAAATLAAKAEALTAGDPAVTTDRAIFLWPAEAEALARTGEMARAQALIAKTAPDCDLCMRGRGRIAARKHDWAGAARWFKRVSVRSPHIPFADADWGEMLLRKGDYDDAIAKFESAHRKGPRFADPLEMWGEALIAKNRSDLALTKFEEAARYAPNWGRLHLKWGEALWWTGDKDGAKKQFAAASALTMTAGETQTLHAFLARV